MLTRLPCEAIAELRRQYPGLRNDYIDYLAQVGWGESQAGRMIYNRPTDPDEIYGPRDGMSGVVLLGDDFQGYCFGYHIQTRCYGKVTDDGNWAPWPESEGLLRYVTAIDEPTT